MCVWHDDIIIIFRVITCRYKKYKNLCIYILHSSTWHVVYAGIYSGFTYYNIIGLVNKGGLMNGLEIGDETGERVE